MKLYKLFLFLMLLFATVFYSLMKTGQFDYWLFDICLVCAVISVVYFFIFSQSKSGKGIWLRPSYLFLFGYLAVNFQFLIDIRIGAKSLDSVRVLHPEILNHCLVLGIIGLFSYILGYTMKPQKMVMHSKMNIFTTRIAKYDKVPFILLLLQFLSFALFILTSDIYSFIRGTVYVEDNVSNAESILYVVNALVVILVSRSAIGVHGPLQYLKCFPLVSVVIISVYILLRLISGDRGPFVYTILLIAFGYLYSSRKKIKFVLIIVSIVSAALLMALVGIARSLDLSSSFSGRMSSAASQFSTEGRFTKGESTIFSLTEEMGYSFYVNQVDVYGVNVQGDGFHYLSYPIFGLLSGIPFMPSILQNSFGVKSRDFSSGGYANYKFFGGTAQNNNSIGTSVVGDFYLSFGSLGVLLGLLLCGMLYRFVDNVIFIDNRSQVGVYKLLFVLLYASKAIYMPRASIFVEIPRFVWGVIIFVVIFEVFKFSQIRKTTFNRK